MDTGTEGHGDRNGWKDRQRVHRDRGAGWREGRGERHWEGQRNRQRNGQMERWGTDRGVGWQEGGTDKRSGATEGQTDGWTERPHRHPADLGTQVTEVEGGGGAHWQVLQHVLILQRAALCRDTSW